MGDGDLLAAVVAHYVQALAGHDDAQAWLSGRGIDTSTAARFGVGMADRTLGLVLPEGNRRAGALLRSRLQGLGVLRSTGHELEVFLTLRDRSGADSDHRERFCRGWWCS